MRRSSVSPTYSTGELRGRSVSGSGGAMLAGSHEAKETRTSAMNGRPSPTTRIDAMRRCGRPRARLPTRRRTAFRARSPSARHSRRGPGASRHRHGLRRPRRRPRPRVQRPWCRVGPPAPRPRIRSPSGPLPTPSSILTTSRRGATRRATGPRRHHGLERRRPGPRRIDRVPRTHRLNSRRVAAPRGRASPAVLQIVWPVARRSVRFARRGPWSRRMRQRHPPIPNSQGS